MALPQGITKEFLDMTYPDQYYKSVIEPAKLGKGPVPGKIEMLSKSQPIKALGMQVQNLFSPGKYDAFRAAPTKAAATALGWGAKGLGYLASLPAQAAFMTLHSTPANAGEVEWEKELMGKYRLQNKKKQQVQLQKFKNIEAKAAAEAKKAAEAKANAAAASQRRAGKGGSHMSRSVSQGGLGISQSQAQAVSNANRAAGMSGWGLADGGLINFYRYGGFI